MIIKDLIKSYKTLCSLSAIAYTDLVSLSSSYYAWFKTTQTQRLTINATLPIPFLIPNIYKLKQGLDDLGKTTSVYIKGVYCLYNVVTERMYVGSANNIIDRIQEHFKELTTGNHKNKYIQKEYNLFGKKAYIFKILERVYSMDKEPYYYDLDRMNAEGKWIDRLGSFVDSGGYNIEPVMIGKETYRHQRLTTEEILSYRRVLNGKA